MSNKIKYLIILVSSLSGFLLGFNTSIIAGSLGLLKTQFHLNTLRQEYLVSVMLFGAFLATLCTGQLADRLGRKRLLQHTATLYMVGMIFVTCSSLYLGIAIGRFLLGVAIGMSSFVAPMYVSEVSQSHERGRLVLINSFSLMLGQLAAHSVNYVLLDLQSWRLMFAVGYLPALAFLYIIYKVPESPRWLSNVGRSEEALANQKILKLDFDVNRKSPKQTQAHWRLLFQAPIRRVFILGALLGMLQQLSGINSIMYYGAALFESLGFGTGKTQMAATLLMSLVNVSMATVAVMTADKFGRRQLLVTGLAICGFSLLLVAESIHLQHNTGLILFGVASFIAAFAMSLGAIYWLIISEIYPLEMRGLAMSAAVAILWLTNFIASATFLSIIEYFGIVHTLMLYAVINFIAMIYCYVFVPETKHVPLEVIEANLKRGARLRDLGIAPDTACTQTAFDK